MSKLKKIAGTPGNAKPSGPALIPVVPVKGTALKEYADLKERLAVITAKIEAAEPAIKRQGAIEVLQVNVGLGKPEVKSVKLVDSSGTAVRVTLAAVYPTMTAEEAEKRFSKWSRMDGVACDVNDYVIETRAAKFNSKALLDKKGDFNQKAFDAFSAACAAVAKTFGLDNPLTSEVVASVRDTFDQKRYDHFDFPTQTLIYEAIPNRTSLTIVAPEA